MCGRYASSLASAAIAIITTGANATLSAIHGRMPVILGEIKGDDAKALLRPAADGLLRAWRVGRRVNGPTHDGPDLLDRMSEAGSPA